MKKILIICLIFVLTGALQAQNRGKLKIGLNYGLAIPTGDFSDKEKGGADNGASLGLTGFYQINKNMSFGLKLNTNAFEYSDDFENEIKKIIPEGGSLELEKWNFVTFMLVPRYSMPVNPKMSLYGDVAIGLAFCNSPEVVAKYNGVEYFKTESASATALALGFDLGACYSINETWGLDFSFGLVPVIEPEYEYEMGDTKTKSKVKQTHMLINFGLNYSF